MTKALRARVVFVLWLTATLLMTAAAGRILVDDGWSFGAAVAVVGAPGLSCVMFFNYFMGVNKGHVAHLCLIGVFFIFALFSAAFEFGLVGSAVTQLVILCLGVAGVLVVVRYWRSIYRHYL